MELNFITLNDIRYLSVIDFKDQIQNSQKKVYLILGHPVFEVDRNYSQKLYLFLISNFFSFQNPTFFTIQFEPR